MTSLFVKEAYNEMSADNTMVHHAHKNKHTVESKLQSGGTDFQTRCIANNMPINLPKPAVMTIGTRQNLQNTDLIEICRNNEISQTTCTQKLLGVIIDNNLVGIAKLIVSA